MNRLVDIFINNKAIILNVRSESLGCVNNPFSIYLGDIQ